jgi:uncharacterized membrane protein YgcG
MFKCQECKRKHTARNCPFCTKRETETIKAADVDSGGILAAIAESLADMASSSSSSASSDSSYDGGGGDFGGGGSSGDW